jgi:hypothetical protein
VRLGLFLALFVSLLGVVAMAMPVPFGPRPIPGGIAPTIGDPPKCLELRYDLAESRELPRLIRMRAERGLDQGWFAADGGPEPFRLNNHSSWRPAGPDSVDIGWYYAAVIRVPLKGHRLVGRGAWLGGATLWELFLGVHDFPVVAHPIPCSSFIPPILEER